jgi:hypothetical protein
MTLWAWVGKTIETLLEKFGLTSKVLCYVKDINSSSMTATLKSMISCEALNLLQPFDGTCFGHAMSKVDQYATNDLAPISVKFAQSCLQSCII